MRSLKLVAVAAVLVVAVAAPAAAHVTVQPPEASQGGYAKLAFRVPNEEDTASTTTFEVQLPADATFQSVSTRPLPGWTAAATDTTITWTGGRIEPGQFQEFEISVGPLPTVDELTFKAIQTYDNGDVVRWIEPTPADGTEPEHPAPVLHLAAGTGDEHGATTAAASDGDDGGGKVVGAYALAAVALALAATAFVQARRKPTGS